MPARTGAAQTPLYACLSCRHRKLKCDKKQPCANCTARSVNCKQQQVRSTNRGIRKPSENPTDVSSILSRLDRIEAILDQTHGEGSESPLLAPVQRLHQDVAGHDSVLPRDIDATGSKEENESFRTDSGRLFVSMSTNDSTLLQALSPDICLSVATLPCANSLNFGMDMTDLSGRSRKVELPVKEETLRLLQIYLDFIGPFQQVLYEPYTRRLIDDVYNQLSHGSTTTAPRGVALIFGILAIAVLQAPFNNGMQSNPTIRERLLESALHTRAALDCLEQARRRMEHTLENVQAMVILTFLINHIEAFSARYHTLLAEAIAVARILNLHWIDVKGKRGLSNENDPILLEIKRRVWWYLIATDWMSSLVTGPGSCAYTSNTKHIAVHIPQHMNIDEVSNPNATEQPLSQPTTMSYVRQRFKMAEIARILAEALPNDPTDATYETILSLDSKVEQFLDDLPSFLKVENDISAEVRSIDIQHPYIPVQRLALAMLINLVRCKLHFPYLVGSTSGALHIFSRETCLKAARRVLGAHQEMGASGNSRTSDFMKIQGTVYHMTIGAVILATDLCCNRPRGAEREQQSSELMRACSVLASIKQHSQIAAKLLESLTELLIKYRVWSPSVTIPPADELDSTMTDVACQQWQLGDYSLENSVIGQQDFDMTLVFDDLWGTFVENPSALDFPDVAYY